MHITSGCLFLGEPKKSVCPVAFILHPREKVPTPKQGTQGKSQASELGQAIFKSQKHFINLAGHLAVGQNQWYHFGVGAPPILVYFSGDWDVHWGYGRLTHGHLTTPRHVPRRDRCNPRQSHLRV